MSETKMDIYKNAIIASTGLDVDTSIDVLKLDGRSLQELALDLFDGGLIYTQTKHLVDNPPTIFVDANKKRKLAIYNSGNGNHFVVLFKDGKKIRHLVQNDLELYDFLNKEKVSSNPIA